MRRAPGSRRAQRGMALLGLLAIVVMVFAYVLTSRLNAASGFVASDRERNAKVMVQAKLALVGYVAQQASLPGENNPGSLPCPEAPANFGTASEGIAAGNCTLPAVGRLPWRTLGLEKLTDAAGEPLWYVVSPGWAMPNSTTPTVINSDTAGQLTVNGAANSAVALIIAPGPAITTQAGTGCAAWSQLRSATGVPDLRNYLECENGNNPADAAFVTSRPGQTFNDQVLRVTAADVIPAIEAAIAERTQREIAPAMRTVYTSAQYSGIPSSSPLYPYAVPFTNPSTPNYAGVAGTYRGLLPVNRTQGCVAGTDPLCQALTITGNPRNPANGSIYSVSCTTNTTVRFCWGRYSEEPSNPSAPIYLEMNATFRDVATGLRALDSNLASRVRVRATNKNGTEPWVDATPAVTSVRMNSGSFTYPDGVTPPRGSVTITFGATLPNIDSKGWGFEADFDIRIERAAVGDHALVDAATSNPLGWFVRNQWHRVHYYRVAEKNTADGLPSIGCSTNSSASSSDRCLRFNDGSAYNIRALLVQAGHSLSNPAGRPNATLSDYLEFQNCDFSGSDCDPQSLYENRPMRRVTTAANPNAPWNDRVILLDWAASLTALQQNAATQRLVALP